MTSGKKLRVVLSVAVAAAVAFYAWTAANSSAGSDGQVSTSGRAGGVRDGVRPTRAEVRPDVRPTRIVSLIPAATEILFALGAEELLVGRTRWGVHPPAARALPDVGDGVRPSLEVVLALEPDLVLLYRGDANRGVAERFDALGVRTLSLDHDTLADLERTIQLLGDLAACPGTASVLTGRIRSGLDAVAAATRALPRRRVYYDVWADPPITIGTESFIDSLLVLARADNVFGDLRGSAPRVSLEAIVQRDPDLVLVPVSPDSLESTPDLSQRPGWALVPAVAEGRVAFVDQDLVSRLGPRVADAAWALAAAVHADLEPVPATDTALACRG